MKKMLSSVMALVLFLVPFFVSAEGSQESTAESKSKEEVVIGFSFPTLREERWAAEKEIAIAYAKQQGVKLIVQDADTDANVQNQQIDNLITQDVDCLIIGPQDVNAMSSSLDAAKEAGIPVISYLRLIDNKGLTMFVGYDFTMIGEDMAKSATNSVPEGNYVVIAGDSGDNVSYQLRDGFYNVIQPKINSGDISVVYEQYIDTWSPENAMSNMENALTNEHNNIQAVLVENDTMAGACIQALKAQGLDGKVFVTGMDGDVAALQRIAEGSQSMTMLFEHDFIAKAAVDAAIDLAMGVDHQAVNGTVEAGGESVPAVLLSASKITSDTLYDIVIGKKLQKMEDVYKNVPKNRWPK
ncbi:sugar ABC transporter substrate-binding protein [Sediminispirochaeta smaragdinae]|uniref:ABC-type ribose transport system, periplasmic component n=1 Tax=Sediminispirochaeta smaragdinae (strain DSM 11293 / JCM 15392 / SEBR 4228) TaxID=573413 RepID=E1R7K5_SEDSS|nr:substrate-binding domain-containing protein [Sediminispirochaeta smaragdinae]ADK82710.1 ABC-type ribose transport system, periplasmic component [Sediminispirochaeta smaragdinae DSM 11293]